jgi:hypothetical protein
LPSHQSFSNLPWVREKRRSEIALDENDVDSEEETPQVDVRIPAEHKEAINSSIRVDDKYWLREDDIGEF